MEGRVVIARVRRNHTYCRNLAVIESITGMLRTEYSAADKRLNDLSRDRDSQLRAVPISPTLTYSDLREMRCFD